MAVTELDYFAHLPSRPRTTTKSRRKAKHRRGDGGGGPRKPQSKNKGLYGASGCNPI